MYANFISLSFLKSMIMNKITIELPHVEETFNYGELYTVQLSEDGSSITINLPSHDTQIVLVNNDDIKKAKYMACDFFGITMEELNTVKKDRPVLGRWLIWEYGMKVKKYNIATVSKFFKRRNGNYHSHSTIIWAMKELKNNRLLDWQKEAIKEFRKRLNELNK